MKSVFRCFVVPGDEIVINFTGGMEVEWGDGNTTIEGSGKICHLYEDSIGIVTIAIRALTVLTGVTFVRSGNRPSIYRHNKSGWSETVISITAYDDVKFGASSFEGCKDIKSIVLKGTDCSYSDYAFASSGVEDLRIERCSSIASAMFYDCRSLGIVRTDDNIKSIGGNAFAGCMALEQYYTSGRKLTITAEVILNEAFMFTGFTNKTLSICAERIGPFAFNNCEAQAFILHGTEKVQYRAFASCENLKHIAVTKGTKPEMHVEAIGCKHFNL